MLSFRAKGHNNNEHVTAQHSCICNTYTYNELLPTVDTLSVCDATQNSTVITVHFLYRETQMQVSTIEYNRGQYKVVF